MPAAGPQPFDPFNHRLSRDLRNDLSEALLKALANGKPDPVLETAGKYRARLDQDPELKDYLEARMACYLVVLEESGREGGKDPDRQALALWNHELFFEFHELLEKRWLGATGLHKLVLQALIRAAGTYIHRRYGRRKGAEKMAARAREIIDQHRRELPDGFEAGILLAALADPAAPPPRFGAVTANDNRCHHTEASG
jgi:hypothetical protein